MAKASARKATTAKAGSRSEPPKRGSHMTTAEDRKRGRWLSKFGMKFSKAPTAAA